tara:strand:+ start:1484 stop:1882 length:399 start_codon:yes stop_codon:yes gene_type:complete
MQKIYNKLAKSNKRSASVKHKVDLSNITELEDHVEFIVSSMESEAKVGMDLLAQLEQTLGFLAGFVDLGKEDLAMAKELRMAVDDLGIETPESLSNTIQLLETFTDGYYDYEALDVHRQSIEYIMGDTLIIR